jgi:hypothetical protein
MHLSRLAVSTTLALGTLQAYAQQAGSIDLGGFELVPSVTTSLLYDDNLASSNTNKISSFASIIAPQLILLNNFGANQLQFGYRLNRGDYFSSSQDNYTDHFLSASLDMELNSRNRFETSLEFEDGHAARGTGFSNGAGAALSSPDQYKEKEFDLVYSYGALAANARIDFQLNLQDLDYDKNVISTVNDAGETEQEDSYRIRDRSRNEIGGIFYYSIASATDLLVELSQTNIDYDVATDPLLPLDSSERAALVGLKWETTAATTGYAKIGLQRKEFDVSARGDFSGIKWRAGIIWQPYERSMFKLDTNGGTSETNGEGNFIRRKDIAVSWQHEWLDRFSTEVGISYGRDSYDADIDVRKDNISDLNLDAVYQFKRWMTVRGGYQFEKRNSNREAIDYDSNVFRITVSITL